MTLKNILEKSVELIGLNVAIQENSGNSEVDLLIQCGKNTLSVLTEEYIDLIATEKKEAIDRKIAYFGLANSVKYIKRIEKNGTKVKFSERPQYVVVPSNGEFDVIYAYNLDISNIDSELMLPPRFSANILAIGVAGEYCFRKGHYTEANAYFDRYEKSLKNILRLKGGMYLGERDV